VVNSGAGTIGEYAVAVDGTLTFLGEAGTLPASVDGLAAR